MMRSHSDLMDELISRSGKSTVYRRIKKMREHHDMLISPKDAVYLVAVSEGLNLFDYLEPLEVESEKDDTSD